ncbi:hypothetical protein LINPERPRIM_LOCUS37730, partial [Linum perenne]
MQLKDKHQPKSFPRPYGGITIREPAENPKPVNIQKASNGGNKVWVSTTNALGNNKVSEHASAVGWVNGSKAKSMPLQHLEHSPIPVILGKEMAAKSDGVLGNLHGLNGAAGDAKEIPTFPKAPATQVPLAELEKTAREFETRKMQIFGQGG